MYLVHRFPLEIEIAGTQTVSSSAGSYPVFLPQTIIYLNETFTKESTFRVWFLESLGVTQWLGITWHFDFWTNIFSWHCREMRQCEGEPYRVLVELTGAKLWSLNWTRRIFHSSVGRLQQLKVSKGNKGRKMSQWETHCTLQELNQRQLKDNWSHVSPCWRQKIKMCKWQILYEPAMLDFAHTNWQLLVWICSYGCSWENNIIPITMSMHII